MVDTKGLKELGLGGYFGCAWLAMEHKLDRSKQGTGPFDLIEEVDHVRYYIIVKTGMRVDSGRWL